MGRRLLISEHTVRTYLENIEDKRKMYERGEDIPTGP
jgi:hypothetical protein